MLLRMRDNRKHTLPTGIGLNLDALVYQPVQGSHGGLDRPDHGAGDNEAGVLGQRVLHEAFPQRLELGMALFGELRVRDGVVL